MKYTPRRSSARWLEGAPRHVIACYDAGPRENDRYTVLYCGPDWPPCQHRRTVSGIAANAYPFHPQGIGLHIEMDASNRAHLGRKVRFADLPPDVLRFAIQDGLAD